MPLYTSARAVLSQTVLLCLLLLSFLVGCGCDDASPVFTATSGPRFAEETVTKVGYVKVCYSSVLAPRLGSPDAAHCSAAPFPAVSTPDAQDGVNHTRRRVVPFRCAEPQGTLGFNAGSR